MVYTAAGEHGFADTDNPLRVSDIIIVGDQVSGEYKAVLRNTQELQTPPEAPVVRRYTAFTHTGADWDEARNLCVLRGQRLATFCSTEDARRAGAEITTAGFTWAGLYGIRAIHGNRIDLASWDSGATCTWSWSDFSKDTPVDTAASSAAEVTEGCLGMKGVAGRVVFSRESCQTKATSYLCMTTTNKITCVALPAPNGVVPAGWLHGSGLVFPLGLVSSH